MRLALRVIPCLSQWALMHSPAVGAAALRSSAGLTLAAPGQSILAGRDCCCFQVVVRSPAAALAAAAAAVVPETDHHC